MLPLLLGFSHLGQLAEAASTNTTSAPLACDATSCNYRSVWSVLGSCALMFIIATWNTIHPPVAFNRTWYIRVHGHARLMLLAFLSPEAFVMRACAEWKYAGMIKQDFHGTFPPSSIQTDDRPDGRHASDYKWTRTHGLFALMGKFRLMNPIITEDEINDKSKSDGLGKALLILQLSWLTLQVSVRHAKHLAITLIEIDTLAMAAMSFPVFYFWWSKPMAPRHPHTFYLVHTPVAEDARGPSHSLDGDRHEPLLNEEPPFTENRFLLGLWGRFGQLDHFDHTYSVLALSLSWVIFGALHLVAWDFQFPNQLEKMMWRFASLTLIITGVLSPLTLISSRLLSPRVLPRSVARFDPLASYILFLLGYFAWCARLGLLILTFTSLRDLPASAYETVSWTTYIPHL
ncbi:hypothetical protein PAXINDRAFT_102789 [Paxillus involutus ATCC 200175]|uniref:Wax synthase domain-containing protein n=1 Tax=Paxillus involutus ATCC 200175 TaxID=664439 RepID=A0A0C9T9Q9_PAXIN|nr:hypothetical protein PAXINDRAFT_102789 [Paxillus involutus ATCC 200175]